jgi:hypothetical protein
VKISLVYSQIPVSYMAVSCMLDSVLFEESFIFSFFSFGFFLSRTIWYYMSYIGLSDLCFPGRQCLTTVPS